MAHSTAKRVLINTGTIIVGNAVSILIGFVTSIFIVRYLGARDLGIYATVFTYLTFVSIFSDLGMSSIIVMEMAKNRSSAEKLIGNAIIIRLILAFISILFSSIVISLSRCPVDIKTLIYIASLSFLFSFSALFRIIFQVNLQMKYSVFADSINSLFKCALVACLILFKASLLWFVIIEVLVNIPGVIIMWRSSIRFLRPKFEIDLRVWKLIIRESWPLAIASFFALLYMKTDVMILVFIKGSTAVGYYSAAAKLTDTLAMLPGAFMVSVFPLMAKYFKESPESLTRAYHMAFRLMASIILPVAFCVSILAPRIMALFYGGSFSPSASVLSMLIWAQVFVFMNVVLHYMVITIGRQKATAVMVAIMAVFNITLNYVLIPVYGFLGTGIARVLTEALGAILGLSALWLSGHRLSLSGSIMRPLIGALVTGAFIAIFQNVSMLFIVPAAVILYCAIEIAIGGISKEDIVLIKSCFLINKGVVRG